MKLLSHLKSFLASEFEAADEPAHTLELAAAMLLFEVVWADHQIEDAELAQLSAALTASLELTDDEVTAVIEDAHARQATHVGVVDYTRLLNEQCAPEQKYELVLNLWRVAGADGQVSAIEEHTIRRISDLLYLPHADFIRAKQQARQQSL